MIGVLLPHARRHELMHRVYHANEAGARGAIAPDDGLGNHWARMSDVRDASLGGGKVYPVPNSSSWQAGRHLPGDKASPQRGHASVKIFSMTCRRSWSPTLFAAARSFSISPFMRCAKSASSCIVMRISASFSFATV